MENILISNFVEHEMPAMVKKYPSIAYQVPPDHLLRYKFAAELSRGKNVLDAGCTWGYGSHMLSLTAAHVDAIDLSVPRIDLAKKLFSPTIRFLVGDLFTTTSSKYDAIVCFEVFEHIERDEQKQFLESLRAMLAPNGILILSTPNRDAFETLISTHNPTLHEKHDHDPDSHKGVRREGEFVEMLHSVFGSVALYGQGSVTKRRKYALIRLVRTLDIFQLRRLLGRKILDKSPLIAAAESAYAPVQKREDIAGMPLSLMAVCKKEV